MSEKETTIEFLRKKLSELREDRDEIMFEKGLSAEENKDLRENATFDYWARKEHNVTGKILQITREITELTHKTKPTTVRKSKSKETKKIVKIKELPRNRWR